MKESVAAAVGLVVFIIIGGVLCAAIKTAMPKRGTSPRSSRRRAQASQVALHSPYTASYNSEVAIARPLSTNNQPTTRSTDTLGHTSLYPPPPYSGGPPSYDADKAEQMGASVSPVDASGSSTVVGTVTTGRGTRNIQCPQPMPPDLCYTSRSS